MRCSTRPAAVVVAGALLGLAPLTSAHAATAPARTAVGTVAAAPATGPSGVTAKGAYLYDTTSGAKLWGRSTTTKRPVGSMGKVMTALIVIRAGNLDRTVTIKKKYVDHVKNNDASSAGLRVGDRVTVRHLLYGTMLPSGCDAAYALADVLGPGNGAFVARMNRTAAALGMTGTHFLTADGLPAATRKEGHSTPRDMMLLARQAMKSATFRSIVAHRTYTISKTSAHQAYSWTNTNLLLGSYGGAIGIKTGHTDGAGYCLLFAAVRGGRTLLGALLNSTTTSPNERFRGAAAMLDWAFGGQATPLRLQPLPSGAATD